MADLSTERLYNKLYPDFLAMFWAFHTSLLNSGYPLLVRPPDRTAHEMDYGPFQLGAPTSIEEIYLNTHVNVSSEEYAFLAYNVYQASLQSMLDSFVVFINILFPAISKRVLESRVIDWQNFPEHINIDSLAALDVLSKTEFAHTTVVNLIEYLLKTSMLSVFSSQKIGSKVLANHKADDHGNSLIEVVISGILTGTERATWSNFLLHAIPNFNAHAHLRILSGVDITEIGKLFPKLGFDFKQSTGPLAGHYNLDLVDQGNHSGVSRPKTRKAKNKVNNKSTYGCPAAIPPSKTAVTAIKHYFPNYQGRTIVSELDDRLVYPVAPHLGELAQNYSVVDMLSRGIHPVEIIILHLKRLPTSAELQFLETATFQELTTHIFGAENLK